MDAGNATKLGFDHKRLTYRYAGRDFRLTDVYGNVVPGLLAYKPSFHSRVKEEFVDVGNATKLGFDHKRLTYRYAGRDFRLTDVYGNVVPGLIA